MGIRFGRFPGLPEFASGSSGFGSLYSFESRNRATAVGLLGGEKRLVVSLVFAGLPQFCVEGLGLLHQLEVLESSQWGRFTPFGAVVAVNKIGVGEAAKAAEEFEEQLHPLKVHRVRSGRRATRARAVHEAHHVREGCPQTAGDFGQEHRPTDEEPDGRESKNDPQPPLNFFGSELFQDQFAAQRNGGDQQRAEPAGRRSVGEDGGASKQSEHTGNRGAQERQKPEDARAEFDPIPPGPAPGMGLKPGHQDAHESGPEREPAGELFCALERHTVPGHPQRCMVVGDALLAAGTFGADDVLNEIDIQRILRDGFHRVFATRGDGGKFFGGAVGSVGSKPGFIHGFT